MSGRPGDASRLPAPDRPSHQSPNPTSHHLSPRRPSQDPNPSRDSSTAEHGPHPHPSSSKLGRSNAASHAPHYYPTAADVRRARDAPTRYERGRSDRRSVSPIHQLSAARPRSSSPPFRDRNVRSADGLAQRFPGGSADSEGFEDSVKSDDPQSLHPDDDRKQQGSRGDPDRYQPPEDVDAAMSSISEPTSRPRSPHKRRTRMLMSRNQWQALSRLWDRTIFPATAEREALAREIGLTPRQVQVWFQNQRQKRRRERETDAANAALVASSPFFAATRTAELPHGWNGEPPPRHWADAEDRGPYSSSSSRQPIPHPHNGFDHRSQEGSYASHGYGPAHREEHPRQGWPELNAQRWRSNHLLGRERDPEREFDRGTLDKERSYERGREFVRELTGEREDTLSSRPRGYYYPGPLPSGPHEERWQHPPRPTLSPHHSYPPPPPTALGLYSGRDSRSPHPPWPPGEPGMITATERTASPGALGASGARHPYYYAPESLRSPMDEHLRSLHSTSSPGSGRQRGPSYLPPSLSALAIDRPLESEVRDRRQSSSYMVDGGREAVGAVHQRLQDRHASPYAQPAPTRPHHPPSPSGSRPQHSREPPTHDPGRTGETTSPPRLPSLSSLLH